MDTRPPSSIIRDSLNDGGRELEASSGAAAADSSSRGRSPLNSNWQLVSFFVFSTFTNQLQLQFQLRTELDMMESEGAERQWRIRMRMRIRL